MALSIIFTVESNYGDRSMMFKEMRARRVVCLHVMVYMFIVMAAALTRKIIFVMARKVSLTRRKTGEHETEKAGRWWSAPLYRSGRKSGVCGSVAVSVWRVGVGLGV